MSSEQGPHIRVTSRVQYDGNNSTWNDIMQTTNIVYDPTGQVVVMIPDVYENPINSRPYDF